MTTEYDNDDIYSVPVAMMSRWEGFASRVIDCLQMTVMTAAVAVANACFGCFML